MDLEIVSYSEGQVQNETLVATTEGQENGKTMWWKPRALLEVTIIKLGWDGENWNVPCLMLWNPPEGGVGRIGGVIAIFIMLTSLVVYRV
jgi:hypothetical protein